MRLGWLWDTVVFGASIVGDLYVRIQVGDREPIALAAIAIARSFSES